MPAPTKYFGTAFAKNGDKSTVPVAPQPSGAVSYDQGFGPDYERQLGTDPLAKNIDRGNHNSLYNDITTCLQELQSGEGGAPYNVDFATAIGGYTKGAVISRSDGKGFWVSIVDSNFDNPDTVYSSKWSPVGVVGTFTQALTNVNVTPAVLDASCNKIILTGTLTGNVNLVLPPWIYDWIIDNRTTGNFTVTVKTPAGSGTIVAQQQASAVYGDGTNIYTYGSAGVPRGGGQDKVFYENDTAVTADYQISNNKNAMSAGPITINSGVTVTVPTGSTWTIV